MALDRGHVHDLYPEDVAKGLAEGKYCSSTCASRTKPTSSAIPTPVYMPMSEFDPAALPDPAGKQVVFACRSGNRSVTASLIAQNAGLPYKHHLAGGIKGWKEAGLPTET
jgi:rhodanese-related sulfurtransferase